MESYYDPSLKPLVETAQRFAKKEIIGKVVKLDSLEKPGFPWEAMQTGGEAGFLTGPLDEELGGANLDLSALAVLVEHLAEGAAGPAAIFASHLAAIAALGDVAPAKPMIEEMAEHYADPEPFLFGIALPATAVPIDRPAVPDVKEEGADLSITGDFICMPAPGVCRRMLIVTHEKEGRVVIVNSDKLESMTAHIHPGSGLDEFPPMGLKLNDFKATDDEILDDASSEVIYRNIRVLLAAAHVGNARAATRTAWEYAGERIQTGRKIIEHQEVRRMLETMLERIDTALGVVRLAAEIPDGEEAYSIARRAFTSAGSAAENICQDAIQTHGGYGYMKDYGVEKRLRDAKSLQCLLGTYPEDILGGP